MSTDELSRKPVTIHVVQLAGAPNSAWKKGSAGTTSVCISASDNVAVVSRARVRTPRNCRSGGPAPTGVAGQGVAKSPGSARVGNRRLGRVVRIEPWGPGDRALLGQCVGDPAMIVHLGGAETPERIDERQARYEVPDSGQFKIVDAETGDGAGWVGYWERDEEESRSAWR